MSVPSTFYYIKLGAMCERLAEEEYKTVVMRFDSEEKWGEVEGMCYDSAIGVFNEGLPAGWSCSDEIGMDSEVTEENAIQQGYVVYRWS